MGESMRYIDTINKCEWSRNFAEELPHDGVIEVDNSHSFFAGFDKSTHYLVWPSAELVAFTEQEIAERLALENAVIIEDVSPRQIRQALNYFNLRDTVEAAVAVSSRDVQDWWEFATVIERAHPMIDSMASALSITPEQVDAVFIYAAGI